MNSESVLQCLTFSDVLFDLLFILHTKRHHFSCLILKRNRRHGSVSAFLFPSFYMPGGFVRRCYSWFLLTVTEARRGAWRGAGYHFSCGVIHFKFKHPHQWNSCIYSYISLVLLYWNCAFANIHLCLHSTRQCQIMHSRHVRVCQQLLQRYPTVPDPYCASSSLPSLFKTVSNST